GRAARVRHVFVGILVKAAIEEIVETRARDIISVSQRVGVHLVLGRGAGDSKERELGGDDVPEKSRRARAAAPDRQADRARNESRAADRLLLAPGRATARRIGGTVVAGRNIFDVRIKSRRWNAKVKLRDG